MKEEATEAVDSGLGAFSRWTYAAEREAVYGKRAAPYSVCTPHIYYASKRWEMPVQASAVQCPAKEQIYGAGRRRRAVDGMVCGNVDVRERTAGRLERSQRRKCSV